MSFTEFLDSYTIGFVDRCNEHLSAPNSRSYDFKTFGYDFQDFFEQDLTKFANSYDKNINIISTSARKNVFPDIAIECDSWGPLPFAIDLKCANMFKVEAGKWKANNIPNNDLGAIDGFQAKISEFGDTFFFFVKYSFKGPGSKYSIDSVHAKPFYHYIGRAKDGLIAYREKDGMMRPCSFQAFDSPIPWIKTREDFDLLLTKTIQKRQVAIVEKMMDKMPKNVAKSVIIRMCSRFEVHPCHLAGKVHTVKKLRIMAKKRNIKDFNMMRKADLLKALGL
jgi:hypothetical protein